MLVNTWAVLRKKELIAAWKAATSEKEPNKIEPLK